MTTDTTKGWLDRIRARLVDDDDSVADIDLLMGIYVAATGEDIPHPYDLDDDGAPQAIGDVYNAALWVGHDVANYDLWVRDDGVLIDVDDRPARIS